jgi:hypothetical protein
MIWGMARLAEHPGDTLMAVYRQRQDRILYDAKRSKIDTEQALTNTLWAMAVLDELDADVAAEVGFLHEHFDHFLTFLTKIRQCGDLILGFWISGS